MQKRSAVAIFALLGLLLSGAHAEEGPWRRHIIDNSSRGADGVRLADANSDGRLDIVTGWEQGGIVRLYLHPGDAKAKDRWPAVTVGRVKSPEDAVLVDLDSDGAIDIISCCEGNTRSVFVHWAPADKDQLLDEQKWKTQAFPTLAGKQLAMYCLPLEIDGKNGIDLVIGSKGVGAKIGWLQSPANARDVAQWKYHPLCDAGWIMSLVASDIDVDGDQDILASDRKGRDAGCLWLERPKNVFDAWPVHRLGQQAEVMFLHHADWNGDRHLDVLVPTYKDRRLFVMERNGHSPVEFLSREITWPKNMGDGKAIRAADIDLDGRLDLVLSTENYEGTIGLAWLSQSRDNGREATWKTHDVSGVAGDKGMKLDDLQTIDLDGDGDLDLLTTEERTGWGVVWFENPTRP